MYKSTSHGLHLIMTLLTGGFWLLIWAWRALSNAQHNRMVDRTFMAAQRGK